MKVEVCVDSILSIQNAYAAKVDRIELCSALGSRRTNSFKWIN